MKKFLNAVWEILEEIGRTKAAAAAARTGNFAESRRLMNLPKLQTK